MSNIGDEIRAKTEAFAADLAVLVRRVAWESVAAALGGATGAAPALAGKRGRGRPRKVAAPAPVAAPTAAKRGRGRPRKVVAPAPAAKPTKGAPAAKATASKKASAAKRPSGAKRPPAELAKLTDKLGEYIKAHPGHRIEPIGKSLGVPTKDLTLPVKKLLAAKKIRAQGQKRATEYFPA